MPSIVGDLFPARHVGWILALRLIAVCMVIFPTHAPVLGQEDEVTPTVDLGGEDALATLKSGIIDFASGSRYEGELNNGKMDGVGTFHYANGDIYEDGFFRVPKDSKGRFISNSFPKEGWNKDNYKALGLEKVGNVYYYPEDSDE